MQIENCFVHSVVHRNEEQAIGRARRARAIIKVRAD